MTSVATRRLAAAGAAAGVLLAGAGPAWGQAKPKTILGRVETAWLGDAGIVLRAKIDTGARTSSLGVDAIETFKRRGADWVRFRFVDEADGAGPPAAPVTLEKKVFRFAALKKKDGPGTEIRPVVLLRLCVADVYQLTQVNLVDRARFDYPLLIGRRFLFGKAVVDVARQYTAPPRCAEMGGRNRP